MTIQEQIELAQSSIDPNQEEKPTVELPEGHIWSKKRFTSWARSDDRTSGVPHLAPGCDTSWPLSLLTIKPVSFADVS